MLIASISLIGNFGSRIYTVFKHGPQEQVFHKMFLDEFFCCSYTGDNCPQLYVMMHYNNNLILILRVFHEMIKRALHDFYQ